MRILTPMLWQLAVALPVLTGSAQAAPDLEVTYSYWLEGQKVADLTVGFDVLRVDAAGLETIVVNHTYWAHGLPGVPTGRTEATAIAHHSADGQAQTLAYTLDFRNIGGGQMAVQRVGTDLKATGGTLPILDLPTDTQARAHQALDPYSVAVLTIFRVPDGECPLASDVLMPEGLVHLSVTTTSAANCRIEEQPVALVDDAPLCGRRINIRNGPN